MYKGSDSLFGGAEIGAEHDLAVLGNRTCVVPRLLWWLHGMPVLPETPRVNFKAPSPSIFLRENGQGCVIRHDLCHTIQPLSDP